MSVDIQKWKAEAHENAAKTMANTRQVGNNFEQALHPETYKMDVFL